MRLKNSTRVPAGDYVLADPVHIFGHSHPLVRRLKLDRPDDAGQTFNALGRWRRLSFHLPTLHLDRGGLEVSGSDDEHAPISSGFVALIPDAVIRYARCVKAAKRNGIKVHLEAAAEIEGGMKGIRFGKAHYRISPAKANGEAESP